MGGRARLLRQHKAIVLVLGNGDLEGVPGQGASACSSDTFCSSTTVGSAQGELEGAPGW